MHQIDRNDLAYAEERFPDLVGWIPGIRNDNGKINPHLTRLAKADGSFVSVFHVKPVYYETLAGYWRPLSEISSYYGNRNIIIDNWSNVHPRYLTWLEKRCKLLGGKLSLKSPISVSVAASLQLARMGHIGLTTLTTYPDPNPETTTCDGAVAIDSSLGWSAAQTAATGTGVGDSSAFLAFYGLGVRFVSSGRYRIDRGHVGFDTSSIGTDSIDSAVCSLYPQSAGEIINTGGGSDDQFFMTQSSPGSNTGLTTADFDAIGDSVGAPTEWSSAIDCGSLNGTAYNDFTFNATGEAGINKSGVTNLGHRIREDKTAAPSYSFDLRNTWVPESAEETGTAKDPKFVVVHSAAAAAFIPRVMFF